MLYVINFIVPLFYLLVLDLASFFISEAGGEKLSFKITILLSISVLLLILKDMLPSTEETLPMIGELPLAPQTSDQRFNLYHLMSHRPVMSLHLCSSQLLRCDLRPGGVERPGGHADELLNQPAMLQ